MAQRPSLTIAPAPSPTAEAAGASRPQPPKAGAQSTRLDPPRTPADHQKATQRLTHNIVA